MYNNEGLSKDWHLRNGNCKLPPGVDCGYHYCYNVRVINGARNGDLLAIQMVTAILVFSTSMMRLGRILRVR